MCVRLRSLLCSAHLSGFYDIISHHNTSVVFHRPVHVSSPSYVQVRSPPPTQQTMYRNAPVGGIKVRSLSILGKWKRLFQERITGLRRINHCPDNPNRYLLHLLVLSQWCMELPQRHHLGTNLNISILLRKFMLMWCKEPRRLRTVITLCLLPLRIRKYKGMRKRVLQV